MQGEYNFMCACPKHGNDIHDGTKNECCVQGILLPMVDNVAILGERGQAPFEDAALRLAAAVTERRIVLKGTAESWYAKVVQPIVDAIKAHQIETAQPETAQDRPEGLEPESTEGETPYEEEMNRVYLAGFAKGYENGFSGGFERGFDTAFKLNPKK